MAFHPGREYLVPPRKVLVTFDTLPPKDGPIRCRKFRVHLGGEAVAQSEFRRGKIVEPDTELKFFVGRVRRTVINDNGSPVFRES